MIFSSLPTSNSYSERFSLAANAFIVVALYSMAAREHREEDAWSSLNNKYVAAKQIKAGRLDSVRIINRWVTQHISSAMIKRPR
jgi:hypothetical protein